MKRYRWLFMLACVVLAFFAQDTFTSTAYAQSGTDSAGVQSNDRRSAQKKGVSASLAAKDKADKSNGPTKTQMWLGIGSIPVMIIVVKYL